MLRKFSLLAVAAALLGAAALAPTSASAYELGGHHGWGRQGGVTIVLGSPGYYGYGYGYDDDCDYDHYRHHPRRWRPF
jgi:4-hydroxybenzoate polyprenyltransferase